MHCCLSSEKLSKEFSGFHLVKGNAIPNQQIWDKTAVQADTDKEQFYYKMDVIWNYLSSLFMAPDCVPLS